MSNIDTFIDTFIDISPILPTTPNTTFKELVYFNTDNTITTDTTKYIQVNQGTSVSDVVVYSNPPINQTDSSTNVSVDKLRVSLFDQPDLVASDLDIQTNRYDTANYAMTSIVPDLVNPYLYCVTDITPVIKFDKNTLQVLSTSTDSNAIGSTSTNPSSLSTISPINQYMYIGTSTSNRVRKIDVETLTVVDTLTLPTLPLNAIYTVAIDNNNTYLYVGRPNNLTKIDVYTFTIVGTLTFSSDVRIIAISPRNTNLYIGLGNGDVVKINSSTFTVTSTLALGSSVSTMTISPYDDFLYVGTTDNKLRKINLSTFTITSTVTLTSASVYGAIDPFGQYGYYGCINMTVIKVDLSTLALVGAPITFTQPYQEFRAVAIDPNGLYVYFGVRYTNINQVIRIPDQIVKIEMSTFTLVNESSVATQSRYQSAVIDSNYQYAYYGNNANSISKIRLVDFTLADSIVFPSVTGTISLNFHSAAIDSKNKYAYFVSASQRLIYKIDLGTFTLVTTCLYSASFFFFIYSCAISPDDKYLYLVSASTPGQIIKIDLDTFTVASTLILAINNLSSIMIRPQGDYAYVASYNNGILRIDLSTFTYVDSIKPDPTMTFNNLTTNNYFSQYQIAMDSKGKYAYYGIITGVTPNKINKILRLDLDTFTNAGIITPPYKVRMRQFVINPNQLSLYAFAVPEVGPLEPVYLKINLESFTFLSITPVEYEYLLAVHSDKYIYPVTKTIVNISRIRFYDEVLLSGLSGTDPDNLVNTTTEVDLDNKGQMCRPVSTNRLGKKYYLAMYIEGKTGTTIGTNACPIHVQIKVQ